MKKNILKIAVFSLVAAAVAVAPTQTLAQEKKEKPTAEKKDVAKDNRTIPFRGTLAAVDKGAKTIKVGERVFQVTSETKMWKNSKPATLDDATVGEDVGGSYIQGQDGKLTAKMLRFGPKAEGAPKPEVKDPAKDRVMKRMKG
jgi:hypothetical protein